MRRGFLVIALILAVLAGTGVAAQGGSRTFPETGQTVAGQFLAYWESHGGLSQQGFPISGEIAERNTLDGITYTVQYFERAVFERHPENAPPYDVLLSQLGTFRYKARYGTDGAFNQVASTDNPRRFPETGKTRGGAFRAYWDAHGGLAQQGFPISDEFPELSALDGHTYTVQYFERAVFEQHPENAPPFDVLLSQLGTFRYQANYGGGAPPTVPPVVTTTVAPPTPTAVGPTAVLPATTPPAAATHTPTPPAPVPATATGTPGSSSRCVPGSGYHATAQVADPAPSQNAAETVSGTLCWNGAPVAGATMDTRWHYKTTTSACSGVTGADGVASCTRRIGRATLGYTVVVDVMFYDSTGGVLASASTSFTPR